MSSLAEQQATYYRDPDTGFLMMPGTKRPDGSWRKPRRIREGYVPQDEVPLYESKGKQWAKTRDGPAQTPPGLSSGILNMKIDTFDSRSLQPAYHIPGLNPDTPPVGFDAGNKAKSGKKKKKHHASTNASTAVNNSSAACYSAPVDNDLASAAATAASLASADSMDPAKKLRNLRKKLRDIEALEKKLKSGEIKTPEPEQLEKVARRAQVEEEIASLEKLA